MSKSGENEAGFLNPAQNASQFLPLSKRAYRQSENERRNMNQYIGELSNPTPVAMQLKSEAKTQPLLLLNHEMNIHSEIIVEELPERKEMEGLFSKIRGMVSRYQI